MKTKTMIFAFCSLVAGITPSGAAIAIVSNIWGGPVEAGEAGWLGDVLHAYSNNTFMNSGLVTIGYFPAEVTRFDIDTIPELYAKLSSFTVITSAAPGSYSDLLGFGTPGYVDQWPPTRFGAPSSSGPIVSVGNPLLGRTLYSIVTSASSLGASTLMSEFALVEAGTIKDDVPIENTYTSIGSLGKSASPPPIIGTIGSFRGDAVLGYGTYRTLKMSYVPETSTALLGALAVLGALGLRCR